MEKPRYRYNSLEDFIISKPLSVDGELDDGWGAMFPVKGREIEGTILFADITSFSKRTFNLSSTATLIFVNNFFTWITAEALSGKPCIIDKYIGDEIMIIFSKEFGSDDPFSDAVQTGRRIGDRDVLSFCPHMGIASGLVTIGFVGTSLKYSCSVFGTPVALAKRCAEVKPVERSAASIVFPASHWQKRSFEEVFSPPQIRMPDNSIHEQPQTWKLLPSRKVEVKNLPNIEVIEIVKEAEWHAAPAEEKAREDLKYLKKIGLYRPKCSQP